jgi:predicted acyl esterase
VARFYSVQKTAELKLFFDRYCKDIHNGWELTPKVRIDLKDAFDEDFEEERAEKEFPLARTKYEKLYLNAEKMQLQLEVVNSNSSVGYDVSGGLAEFDFIFEEDTELTGYMKLHAFVEAIGHNDMDLFITIKKVSPDGIELPVTIFDGTSPHPGAWGKIRVSHRELDEELSSDFQPIQAHKRELKLNANEIVPVDVEIHPTSRFWHKGEILRLQIAPAYMREKHWIEPLIYETDNKGQHIIHTGGEFNSYLQIPVIPPKHDRSKPFIVDEEAHPTHPIF